MSRRVLVIDDDASLGRLLRVWLSTEGFNIAMAQHGLEGLARVEAQEPDLILLDLQMPVMDGRTFFKELRSRGFEVPVIVMSAYGATAIAEEMGAQGFMAKPFEPEVLLEMVDRVIDDSCTGNGRAANCNGNDQTSSNNSYRIMTMESGDRRDSSQTSSRRWNN